MQITFFGIIWMAILVYMVFFAKMKTSILILMIGMLLQCNNVIILGKFNVGPQIISCVAFCFKCFIYKTFKMRLNYRVDYFIGSVLIFVCSIILSTILQNGSLSSYFALFQIMIYALTLMCLKSVNNYVTKNELIKMFDICSFFVICVGFLQLAITTNTLPSIGITKVLLFNDNSPVVYFNEPNYNRITSVFMEPSYCACFLSGCLFVYLKRFKFNFSNVVWIGVILIEILLTKSTTAYVGVFIALLLFGVMRLNDKGFLLVFMTGLLGALLLLIFNYELLNDVLFNKMNTGSANARHYWNLSAIEHFFANPLFGAGYDKVRASSLALTVLGQLGIFGMISFINLGCSLFAHKSYKFNDWSIFVICVLIAQFIAVPDLHFNVLRFGLFFFTLDDKIFKKETLNDICRNEWEIRKSII